MNSTKDKKNLEKVYELSASSTYRPNLGGYYRCSCCNSVSNESIETDLGDFKYNLSFVNDPKDDNHFICITCSEAIEDVRRDFQYMDEWKEDQ